jgi:FAD synthetase
MVTVMATGTFDILHMGHIYFLKEAKKLGDKLVVVVACDKTVRRLKHEPVTPEKMRLNLIKELRIVDEAVLGKEDDMFEVVNQIQPDVIALGYDQIYNEKSLQKKLDNRNISARLVRLPKYDATSDLDGTRHIIAKIIEAYGFQKEMEKIEQE